MSDKTAINAAVEARWNELIREGKHGIYETLFRIVHEQRAAGARAMREAILRDVRETQDAFEQAGDKSSVETCGPIISNIEYVPIPEPK